MGIEEHQNSITETIDLDEDADLSIREIWNLLQKEEELILVIEKTAEERIRRSLSNIKSKQNAKLKAEGFPLDLSILDFEIIPDDTLEEDEIKIRCMLSRGNKPPIRKIIIPEGF